MLKRLDKLIFNTYIGPFLVTLPVVTFIFLVQTILKYLDDLVGKDVGFFNFIKLIFYFTLNLFPACMPLAILMSSLIAFGNLGQHNELTAIKSSGISLARILMPVFLFICLIAGFMYWYNDTIVPKANLKLFSLLYDIRHKKPALDIREGQFYNGIPGYSIKVAKKYPDGKTLKSIMIYNHNANQGNIEVTLADSGQMYTIMDNKYLVFEMYRGNSYIEQLQEASSTVFPQRHVKSSFKKLKYVFSLASFELKKTQEDLFKNNRMMRTTAQIKKDLDSLDFHVDSMKKYTYNGIRPFFNYKTDAERLTMKASYAKIDLDYETFMKEKATNKQAIFDRAINQARNIKTFIQSHYDRLDWMHKDAIRYRMTIETKVTTALICIVFFLIGAPLGAIIKKGGLGVPMLLTVVLFVLYYVVFMTAENWAREDKISVFWGSWMPIFVFLPLTFLLLYQARVDSRLFDSDLYTVIFQRITEKFKKNKKSD